MTRNGFVLLYHSIRPAGADDLNDQSMRQTDYRRGIGGDPALTHTHLIGTIRLRYADPALFHLDHIDAAVRGSHGKVVRLIHRSQVDGTQQFSVLSDLRRRAR